MNHKLWTSVAARVLALTFVIAGVGACTRHHDDGLPAAASPSAQVIGTAPAPPSGDPPGTTPVASNTDEVSKTTESTAMPRPGQANDHSNLASNPSQKAGAKDPAQSRQDAK